MEVFRPLLWPDYLILAIFLVASLGIGLYHALTGGRQKTTAEFIMANRNMGVLPTSISLLVSFQSAIMVLGFAAEMYWYGIQLLILISVSLTLVTILVVFVFIPWLVPLKLVSIYEYLDLRFSSKAIRIFGAMLGIGTGILYMGVAMYAPSAALESATGLPLKISIPLMAVVTISCTALGGMRAVIWTDVFQFLTMLGGITAILVKSLFVVGGISKVLELSSQEGRFKYVDWDPDPRVRHTFWGFIIGGTISWCQVYGLSQASVQRFGATKDLAAARLTMILNLPGWYFMAFVTNAIGLVVLAYYASIKCDPLASHQIDNFNQLLPHFVMTMFSNAPGFGGLFFAVLYGGALSSVSSSLSGSAANCWEDILKWKFSAMQESRKALVNRFLVIIFGLISVGVAFLSAAVPGPITQVTTALCGSVSGPLMGLFLLGGTSRRHNSKGALIGGCFSIVVTLWLSAGSIVHQIKQPTLPPVSIEGCNARNSTEGLISHIYSMTYVDEPTTSAAMNQIYLPNNKEYTDNLEGLDNFYAISYVWYVFIGAALTFIIGSLASLPFRDRNQEEKLDEKYLINIRKYVSEFTLRSDPSEQSHGTLEPLPPEYEMEDSARF